MKNLISFVIPIIFLVVGFLFGQSWQLPEAMVNSPANEQEANTPKSVTYSLSFSPTEVTEFQDVEFKANQTVLDLLTELTSQNNLELQTKDYGELGVLVTKIGDKENGEGNKYWQYFVNGAKPLIAADGYQLTGGENVEWKFTEDEGIN
ncbi:MAG: DUF4430 domain-containing protein [Candidatus Komeilibacteria bacterium]|nr:DUF4430 domain-containing protein [Candidatus Komeilibacteria bacterium]